MKNILKLAIAGFITIIPVVIIEMYLFLFPMNYMDGEYPYWKANKDFIEGKVSDDTTENFQNIILGDSVPNGGIRTELLNGSVYNLAVGGMTPIEAYYEMKYYLMDHSALRTAFIAFGPNHIMRQDCWVGRTQYFNYLKYDDVKTIIDTARRLNDSLYITSAEDARAYRIKRPDKFLPALFNSDFSGRRESNLNNYELTLNHKGSYVGVGSDTIQDTSDSTLASLDEFSASPTNDFYYHKLIDLLLENGVDVFIIQNPVKESSFDKIKPDVLDAYWKYYRQLASEYKNIHVEQEFLLFPDTCYIDGAHVNYYGAAKWTNSLKETYADKLNDGVESENKIKERVEFLKESSSLPALLTASNDAGLDVKLWMSDESEIRSDDDYNHLLDELPYSEFTKPTPDQNGDIPFLQADIYDHSTGEMLLEKNYSYSEDKVIQAY